MHACTSVLAYTDVYPHILNMHPRAADGCLCAYTHHVDKLIFPPTQILYIPTLYILHISRKYHGVHTFFASQTLHNRIFFGKKWRSKNHHDFFYFRCKTFYMEKRGVGLNSRGVGLFNSHVNVLHRDKKKL